MSFIPVENLLQKGADYGLSSIGFDKPYTRDLLSTSTVEAFKIGLTWRAIKATPPVLRIGGQFLKPSTAAVRNFVAERTFRSPITLQYDSAKFYSGIPIDIFKPQKPWIKKDVLSESVKSHRTEQSPNIKNLIESIESYFGLDFKMIKNKHGDPIFINTDNTKRIRFDVFNSHGELPHGHLEYFTGTRWSDATSIHRIILKDASELIHANPPKLDK